MNEYEFQGTVRDPCRDRSEEHYYGPAMTCQEMRLKGQLSKLSVGLSTKGGWMGGVGTGKKAKTDANFFLLEKMVDLLMELGS